MIVTKFAARRQLVLSELDRQAQRMYAGGSPHFARELIDGETTNRPDYPIERFSQLVQMFESGRVLELQIVVALVASIIGAIIGAGATIIANG
jgi:hypothetical protein